MKRPVVAMLLIWGIGLFLWLKAVLFMAVTLVLFFILYVSELNRVKLWHFLIGIAVILLSVFRVMHYDYTYDHEKTYMERSEVEMISGLVSDSESYGNGYRYVLREWTTDEGYFGNFELIYSYDGTLQIGDRIHIKAEVKPIGNMRNEGGFDNASYMRQRGITAVVSGEMISITATCKYELKRSFLMLRDKHFERLSLLLPYEQAGIIGTLLLGLDTVEDEIETKFRRSGLIHILAISGLHVSIIAMGFYAGLRRLLPERSAAVVTMLVAGLYCIYTGGQISTVRATVMVSLYLISKLTVRRYDPTTSLAAVAFILLIRNPYQIMNAGFLLSFSAVASIFYITPALKRDFIKSEGFVQDQIRTMLAVQIGLAPVMIYCFHTVSVYSLMANLLVLPVVSLVIGFSIVGLVLSCIWMQASLMVMGTVFFILNYVLKLVSIIERLPFNQMTVGDVSMISMGIFSLFILLWLSDRYRKLVPVVGLSFILSVSLNSYVAHNKLSVHFMDVGQGDAAVVMHRGRTILIDGGGVISKNMEKNVGSYVLMPFLREKGIGHIDTVFISHSDYDHIYGIIEIVQHIRIERVILSRYDQNHPDRPMLQRLLDILPDHTEIIYMSDEEQIQYDELSFECLSPFDDVEYEDSNSASLILKLDYRDFEGVFLGDVSKEQELSVLSTLGESGESIEFIKVAHHGSQTGTDEVFYDTLQPVLSVVSVGHNTYGQPAEEVMDILEDSSDMVLTTVESGAVMVSSNGSNMVVDVMVEASTE